MARLVDLRSAFSQLQEATEIPGLTIFCAGSYARMEASEHSDIDLFFLCSGERIESPNERRNSLKLFGEVIRTVEGMKYPPFSNDCEYLKVLHTGDMLQKLGHRADDHENYFTARMLLLLESAYVVGEGAYKIAIREIVDSYFRDYPDHADGFWPTFLINDICRYWKTMLLNYENKRNFKENGTVNQQRKKKQKVRNWKLKYSRMTTCFATIAAIGVSKVGMTKDDVLEIVGKTPRERLNSVSEKLSSSSALVHDLLNSYDSFLELTGLPTIDLEEKFDDTKKLTEMFSAAGAFGDKMFELLRLIDKEKSDGRLLRTLVI